MAYAVSGDAVKYTGRSREMLSSSSPVSVEDVDEIINDIAAEIDGVLHGLDITVPVEEATSPVSFAYLKKANSIGAAAMVELRLFGEASPGDARNARHTVLMERYKEMLQMIIDGEVLLSDATGGTISDADLGASTGYLDDDGNVVVPFFKRKDIY